MTEVVCMLRGTLVQIQRNGVCFKQKPSMDFCCSGHGVGETFGPRNLTLHSGRVVVRNGTASWGGGVFVGGILDVFKRKMHEDLGRMEGAY